MVVHGHAVGQARPVGLPRRGSLSATADEPAGYAARSLKIMTDHSHEAWEVFGLDSISRDASEALSVAESARQEAGAAEDRISELESRISELDSRVFYLESRVLRLED